MGILILYNLKVVLSLILLKLLKILKREKKYKQKMFSLQHLKCCIEFAQKW